jgi:hypothetical protein
MYSMIDMITRTAIEYIETWDRRNVRIEFSVFTLPASPFSITTAFWTATSFDCLSVTPAAVPAPGSFTGRALLPDLFFFEPVFGMVHISSMIMSSTVIVGPPYVRPATAA